MANPSDPSDPWYEETPPPAEMPTKLERPPRSQADADRAALIDFNKRLASLTERLDRIELEVSEVSLAVRWIRGIIKAALRYARQWSNEDRTGP